MTLPLSQATLEEYNASTHNANKSLLTNYNPLLLGMASDWQEVWDSILSATTYTRAIVKGRWMDSLLGIRVGGELISFNATLHWFWILMVSFGVWECAERFCVPWEPPITWILWWKLPMFGCTDSAQVLKEVHEAKNGVLMLKDINYPTVQKQKARNKNKSRKRCSLTNNCNFELKNKRSIQSNPTWSKYVQFILLFPCSYWTFNTK